MGVGIDYILKNLDHISCIKVHTFVCVDVGRSIFYDQRMLRLLDLHLVCRGWIVDRRPISRSKEKF